MVLSLSDHPEYTDEHKQSKALQGMVMFGVGEVVGGVIPGFIIDKIGSKFTSLLNVLIIIIMYVVTIICVQN
jgi:predicted MFS family arabinose efflux permease